MTETALSSTRPRQPKAAYVHVPFCRHRCGYCNFTLIAGRDDLVESYLEALERELSLLETPRPVDTIFLGGGTPSHLPPDALRRLLRLVEHWFPLAAGGEFSLEANPLDLTAERLRELELSGVTRISLGVQSFQPDKLRVLERDHSGEDVRKLLRAVAERSRWSRSIDLIFGAPGETLEDWNRDLEEAVSLRPDHVSLYGLTFERGTSFWSRRLKGELRSQEEEVERAMYVAAMDLLVAAGYEHYETSNFALPGKRCRHNETYWAAREYYGVGPGAARFIDGVRSSNHRSTTTWLARLRAGQSPIDESESLGPEDKAREALVLGLRRVQDGIDRQAFVTEFGYDVDELGGVALPKLVASGLLENAGGRLRLTREGLLLSDWIWSKFVRC